MSYFKAKMQQNWFLLGLCPRPRWGSLQRSPDPLAGFKGPYFQGREGKGGNDPKERGKGGEEKGKGKEGKGPTSMGVKGRGRKGEGENGRERA